MKGEKFKNYIVFLVSLLKKLARKAKQDASNPIKGSEDYAQGVIMGYYSIITLLKNQAFAFCMDQKELGLADIKPDEDLLGLCRNPDIDFGEDNWEIDVMNEEKIKGYLGDTVALLKEQAKEAKKNADDAQANSVDYNSGVLMAYHEAISIMKNQTAIFGIEQKDVGLADIDPEHDLS